MNKNIKTKKIIYFIVMFLLVALIAVMIKNKQKKDVEPIKTPEPVKFELISTYPASSGISTVPLTTAIKLDFSKAIDISNLVVNVSPQIEFQFETDNEGKTLYIKPIEGWQYNIKYTFNINVTSIDKDKLDTPIEYVFQTQKMTSSDLNEIWIKDPTPQP